MRDRQSFAWQGDVGTIESVSNDAINVFCHNGFRAVLMPEDEFKIVMTYHRPHEVAPGAIIKVTKLNSRLPFKVPVGCIGTVTGISVGYVGLKFINVTWDNGARIWLESWEDLFELVDDDQDCPEG